MGSDPIMLSVGGGIRSDDKTWLASGLLRRHDQPLGPKPPRPRRPLDLLLVAAAEEGLHPDVRIKTLANTLAYSITTEWKTPSNHRP